jgi:DNA/RNA-binding domain of Phe-tRNA-synthetase-like protein
MPLRPDASLAAEFPGLEALAFEVRGIRVEAASGALAAHIDEQCLRYRQTYALETLKDEPRLRAYRDFFWRVGIDPTKTRPAAEALLRRVLQGKPLPRINTFVDAYNLASMETRIALAAFDLAPLRGPVRMRRARPGETFHGIGMDAPAAMTGAEVVCEDDERLIAIYPHRDAEASKVTLETRDVLCLACGVPGIPEGAVREAAEFTARLVTRFCGGTATRPA